MKFEKINKKMGITCGGLALFQLCSNNKFCKNPKSIKDIRLELKINETTNIDLPQIMFYLKKNNFNATFFIKKNSFGDKGLKKDLENFDQTIMSPKQNKYINILKNTLDNNQVEIIEEISKELFDKILNNTSILIVNIDANIFSKGEFLGQHIVLIHNKTENDYVFTGEKELSKSKNLFIKAIKNTKIQSFIEVKPNE